MNTMQTTVPSQIGTSESPCRCHEQAPAPCTCCGIPCFDRPNYFCGHLLTDADLSLEQKYVREKNKLYHRAIDGYGIACGLKITCDPQCKGFIRIHEGFAIDDCGQDLVVCETTTFDVIGTLKKKGLLVIDEPEDKREPMGKERRCEIKQCFYITICYEEEESNYETPFQSGCTPGPKQCLPTRTKERVRFDVVDKLPPERSHLIDLEERFKHCFEIYSDGPIGRYMSEHIKDLQVIVEGKLKESGAEEPQKDPCELFCTLRAHFLNRLKIKPDEFNCGLVDEVYRLTCPVECRDDEGDKRCREAYYKDVQEAFRKLLLYMQQYQFDCALGELVFGCHETCQANCLVLGTVEVVDGKLMRVCNTPRKYLWSPANFIPVLLFNLFDRRPSSEISQNEAEEKPHRCCPDYPRFLPREFLREFQTEKRGRFYAATSPLRALAAVRESLQCLFDFTDSSAVSSLVFEKLQKEDLGVRVEVTNRQAADLSVPTPMQALMENALLRPKDSVTIYKAREGEPAKVVPDFVAGISPDRFVGRNIEELLHSLDQRVTALEGRRRQGRGRTPGTPESES